MSRLKKTYIIALTLIAVLSASGYLLLNTAIEEQKVSATVINISGRQRRLCQTIALQCLNIVILKHSDQEGRCRSALEQTLTLMQNSHDGLTKLNGTLGLPTSMPSNMRTIYFEKPENLDNEVRSYIEKGREVLALDDAQLDLTNPLIRYFTSQAPANLTKKLDNAVHRYELNSQGQIERIESLELSFLLLTLLLLGYEVVFIFAPMSREIERQMRELRDSQLELSAIFDTIGDALLTLSSDRKITSANRQVQSIWGETSEEMIGREFDTLLSNSKTELSIAEPDIIGKYWETEAVKKTGETIPLELIATKTNLSDRHLFTVSLRDITERKLLEKQLIEVYAMVAHELRSPLTSINGSLALLLRELSKGNDKTTIDLLKIGLEESRRLTRLVDKYLDLEKIASGHFELKKQNHSLYAMAKSAADGLGGIQSERKVSITVEGPEELQVHCDRDAIIQVLTNLLSNAMKFSPADSLVSIKIEGPNGQNRAICSVIDQGPGIAAADIPKLFCKFQQIDNGTGEKIKGTGLGLALSKALLEQHGGNIGVNSAQGAGTTFWFELPCVIELANPQVP